VYRGLPEAEWSPELNAKLTEISESKLALWDADISEMRNMPADELWLQKHRRSFGARPIRVLTSGNHAVGHLETQRPVSLKHLKYEYDVALAQSRWLDLSSNARQIFTGHSSEYIQFDAPDVVVGAVREVYEQSSKKSKRAERTLGQRDGGRPGAVGSVFRECPDCPEMVVIPVGTFAMGSTDAEKAWAVAHGAAAGSVADEAPQHAVSVRSFALGKYTVTRSEFAAFVKDSGYTPGKGCYETGNPHSPLHADASWQAPGFDQTDRDPAICVSWNDAQAYVAWLNRKLTGNSAGPYRLPSEAEWEYAARGGSVALFWWGDAVSAAADHAWFKDNAGGVTHPVGLKPANGFGLEDMTGNVWQWTEDCYAESYAGAPADGSPVGGKEDCLRSDRGGSWFYPAWLLRSATRERNPADYRDTVMGFRVARALTQSQYGT
jgi:formylglycine-generating enzyme required for sulfatase activity